MARPRPCLLAALLCACEPPPADCELRTTWYLDADQDGFGDSEASLVSCSAPQGHVPRAGDCDDQDPAVSPVAEETWYDGVDGDCDGADDYDRDGDGYATDEHGGEDCDDADPGVRPGGYDAPYDDVDSNCDGASDWDFDADGHDAHFSGGRDCDDQDPEINPDAEEIWYDGVDQDCDEGSDYDQDGDSWTSAAHGDGGDCDDLDPEIHPEAEETWYDGTDQDCDGRSDYDQDGDGFDHDEWGGTDCEDEIEEINPRAFEWNDDEDNNCDGDWDLLYLEGATARFWGEGEGHQAGSRVAGAGDVDGDGLLDVLVSAPGHAESAGAVYLQLGPLSGGGDLWYADARFTGETAGDEAGLHATSAGDMDGDGYDDLLADARYDSSAGEQAGAVYLLRGPITGDWSLADADVKLSGEGAGDRAGQGLSSAGDLNADGQPDVIVGADGNDAGGSEAGSAYVFYSHLSSGGLGEADLVLRGKEGQQLGHGVAGIGDSDGDGFDDLLVGAPGDDAGRGAAYLLLGPVSSDSAADSVLIGEAEGDLAGWEVAGAGDTNADGYDDLLVAAPWSDYQAEDGGAAYVLRGPLTGESQELAKAQGIFSGDTDGVLVGYSVAGAGDVDGDGCADVLAGAPQTDMAADGNGVAFLMLGPLSGSFCSCGSDAKLYGVDSGEAAGSSVALPGDLNLDGYGDLLIGGPGLVSARGATGGAYVVLGAER